MKLSKKFSVKIPKDIKIIYYVKQNNIIFVGPLGRKLLKLKLKLLLQDENNCIYVTKICSEKFLNNRKKALNALRGTTVSYLKQILLEVSILLTRKLKLVGVGYKIFPITFYKNEILQIKLGYSHPIYYKISKDIKIISFKSIYIYIFGMSYSKVNQIAANIRLYKVPELYKGKGILYHNEKVLLKEGKKT